MTLFIDPQQHPFMPPQPATRNPIRLFQEALNALIVLINANRFELDDLSYYNREDYSLETDKIKGLMDAKGTTGLELGVAAATLTVLSLFAPHLGPELLDSLGGADQVKNLLEASSRFAEGAKPVFNTWDDAKITKEQTRKEFLEHSWKQALEFLKDNKDLIPSLMHAAEKVTDTWSETGYQ